MKEIESGLYKLEDDEEMERFEQRSEELKELLSKLGGEQRVRLNANYPQYPWFADVCFAARDIKNLVTMLQLNGDEVAAEALSEIVGKTMYELLKFVFHNDETEVEKVRIALKTEGDMLDAVLSKAMSAFNGEKEQ